jgi:eukaryotic-like serine/threonine-protein kinase
MYGAGLFQTPGRTFSPAPPVEAVMSLESTPGSADISTQHGGAPLLDGQREIGPYKLLSILGDGGMGVVYLAEQTEPVRRRVALKVLKLGMDTEQVVARFETERQALAVMDHPNIARVVDAGVTPRGRPYFAMEYVRGTTITHYADTHCLTTTERLKLFLDVCHAVQHAHHKGVIHRDLKPSNVLVAAGDEGPVVKVIDFGIARAAGLGFTDRTLVTHIGQMIGTPEYMSPEQAEMSGLDIDTRTDIYSLGVLLYELTVGALPYDLSAKPDYVIMHTLRERDVPRPSTRLTSLGDSLDVIARHRGTTPDALRRTLRGDIDWIVLKAMEKDRTRRYSTASGLAADIDRYLSDHPIIARPPSTRYRLRKFVRRNRVPVLAGAVVFVALGAGAAGATMGLVEARRAQLQAERSAATAQQVSDFLTGLFRVSDPSEARGNTITAREVLDRGADRIREELAGQPAVQARLMHVMGDVYRQLGLYSDARPLLESGVAVAERADDVREAGLAGILSSLGELDRVQGDPAAAEAPLLRAVELARMQRPPDAEALSRALMILGGIYTQLGRYDEAEPVLLDALRIQQEVLRVDHPQVGVTLNNLATLFLYQNELDRAEPYLRQSIAYDERVHGPDHPETALTFSNLGAVHFIRGRHAEAQRAYLRAYAIMSQALEPDHPRMAGIHNNLGEAYSAQGRYQEAESHLTQALELKERIYGATHVSLASTLEAMAGMRRDQARYADAEPLYRRAIAIREAAPEDHPSAMRGTLEAYARMLRLMQRNDEAAAVEARAATLAARES